MSTGDLSINSTGLASVLLAGGTVNEGNALTEVPLGFGSAVDTLQLDDGGLRGLEVLTTLISKMTGLDVETKKMSKVDQYLAIMMDG